MTTVHQQAEDITPAEAKRAYRAYRLLLTMGLIIGAAAAIIFIRLATDGDNDLSDTIEPGMGIVAALFILVGAFLAKNGRVTPAITLVAAILFGLDMILISRISGIGLPLTISFTLIIVLLASQTLPARSVTWGVVIAFLTGAGLIILDLFWPGERGSIDGTDLRIINITSVILVGLTLVVAIRQFFTYTLRTKLVSAAVTLVIITVVLTTVVVNNITRRNLTEQLNEQFHTVSTTQASAISELLGREVNVLQAFSLDSGLISLLHQSNREYNGSEAEIAETIRQLNDEWLATPEGGSIVDRYTNNATASILYTYQYSFPENVDMLVTNRYGALAGAVSRDGQFDQSREAWWQAAYNNGEGAVYIGSPEKNPDTGNVGIPMAVPIYSGVELIGILRTTLTLTQLRELLAQTTGDLGETVHSNLLFGDLTLHDEDAHEGGELHLEPLEMDPTLLTTLRNSQSPNIFGNIEGQYSLIHLGVVSTFGHIPAVDALDWSIVIHQPEQDALAPVQAQQQVSILLAMVAIGVGSLLATYFARLFTGPINRLTDTAVLISNGDFNRQASVETQDEIGTLAQAFNNMTAQLRAFIGTLESRVADRTQALATSTEVSRRLSTILDLDELVTEVVNQTGDAFHYYHVQIFLFDASRFYLLMAGGTGQAGQEMLAAGHKLRISQGVVGRAAATNRVVLIPDVSQDDDWLPNPRLPETRTEAAIPISLGDEVLGVLDVQHDVIGGLTDESVALLQSIANQVAIAIQNAQQVEQTNIQYDIASELAQATQPEQILAAVSGYGRRLGASSAQLLFIENDAAGHPEWAMVSAAWQLEKVGIAVDTRYYLPDFGLASLWLSSPERPLLIPDTTTHESLSPELSALHSQSGILATAVLPLYAQGRWAGLILFNWDTPHPFTSRDERVFTNLAQQTFSVVEAVRAAQHIQNALQEAEQLYQVSQRLSRTITLEESLVAAFQFAIDGQASNASLLTFDLDYNGQPAWAEIAAVWSRSSQSLTPLHTRFYLPNFPMSRLWLSDAENPLFLADIEADERVDADTKMLFKASGAAAAIIMPLTIASRWVGLTVISWNSQQLFTAQEKRIYRSVMGQLASIVDRTRQFERSEMLSAIVENHPDLIGVGTLEGKPLYINPSGLKLLGYALDHDISQMDILDFYSPEEAQKLVGEGVPTAMQEGGWAAEANLITAVGTTIPVEETIGINYDVDNHATGFSITMRDISERKAAEEAIRTSEQLARSFQDKLTILQEITTELGRQETLSDVFRQAIEMGHTRLGFDRLGIWTFDEEMTMMHGTFGTDRDGNLIDELNLSHPLSNYEEWLSNILNSREHRIINEHNDLYEGYDVAGQGWHVTSLLMRDDRPLGYVAVDNLLNQRPLQPYEPDLITLFANALAGLMVNKRAQQAVAKQAQDLQTVADVSRIATTILDVNELLQRVSDLTKERFDLYHVHIYLLSEDEQYLTLAAGAGAVGHQMVAEGRQIALRQKQSLVAQAARTREGVIANDVQAEAGFLPHPLLPETRSELATPLIAGEQVLGVLDIQASERNYFTETDINIQTTLASQIATAIQNARQYQRTQEALDELTRMQQMLLREGWESFLASRETGMQGYVYEQHELQPIKRNGTAVEATAVASEVTTTLPHLEPLLPASYDDDTAVRAPLTVRGSTIGVLGVRDPSGKPVSADKQVLLASISLQVAEALERARLFEESEISRQRLDARARQLAAINRVATAVAQQLEPEQLLTAVYEEIKQIIPADSFYVSFYHEETNTLEIPVNFEAGNRMASTAVQITPTSQSYKVIQSGERVLVNLTPEQVRELQRQVIENTAVTIVGDREKPPTATQLFVPLQTGSRVTGIISVQSYAYNAYTQDDLDMLSGIASYVAVGLENSRLFTQTQEKAEELALINEVAQVVSQQLDIEQVLSTVHDRVSQFMQVDAFAVSRYDPASDLLTYLYIFDAGERHVQPPAPLSSESMSYQIITSGVPILRNYTFDEHQGQQNSPTIGVAKLPPSIMFAPLAIGSQTVGVLSVQSYEFNAYTPNDLDLLVGIANHMTVALENARLFTQTQDALSEAQKRTEELALVNRIVTQLGASLDIQEAMKLVAQGLVEGLGVHQSRIALLDDNKERLTIVGECFDEAQNQSALGLQIPVIGNDLTQQVMATREPVVVEDALTDPLTKPVHDMLREQGVFTLAVLPMLVGNDVIGTVGLDMLTENEPITAGMLRLAETIIFQAAATIQNTRLFAQTQAALQEVQALFTISAELNAAVSLNEVVVAASVPALAVGAISGTLFKFELDTAGQPEYAELAATTAANPIIPLGTRFSLESLLAVQPGLVTNNNETVVMVADVSQDENLAPAFKMSLEQTKTRACVFMMLAVGSRQLGSILIRWGEPHSFTEADRRLYSSIAAQTASVVDSILLLDEVQQRATELQETTGFLDSVVENLPVMLFVKDAEHLRFVRWNKAGSDITGFPQESFMGKSDYDFFPEEDAAYFIAKDREVLAGGLPIDIPDEAIQTANRGMRILHTRKMPIMDADGKPKYLLGISEDITERREFEEALAKRAMELQMVAEISTAVAANLDTKQLLQDLVDLTRDNFDLYHAHIYLLNDAQDTLVLAAGAGKAGAQMVTEGVAIPLDSERSLVARAVRSRQGVIVNDVLVDPGFLPNPLLPKTRSEMAVPLVIGSQVMGVLDVQSDKVNHFTTQDINIQTTLASQVAAALQNARLFNQTEERAAELVTINVINQVASSQLDLNTLLYAVGERLQETFDAHAVYIALYTEATNMMSFPYFFARDEGHVQTAARLADEQGGLSAQIIQTRKPLLLELTSAEDAKSRGASLSGGGRLTDSYLGVPMVLGEQVLGVIGLSSYREVHMYDETDRNLLITLASTIGVAIQNAQQFEVTRRRAERERIVNEITQKIQSSLSMESALQTAVKELGNALGAQYTQVDLQLNDKFPALPENGDGDLRQKTG